MRQQILNALKAKFQGVSEQILDRVAAKLAQTVTTAEQVQTAVDGVTIQQVIESYGDSRATQAQQTAVHNYEAKWGLRDGQKINVEGGAGSETQQGGGTSAATAQQPQGGAAQTDTTAQLLQQLLEQNKKLNERLDTMDKERTTAGRKQQISSLIEKLPENIRKAYSRTPVDGLTEDEFKALVGEITTEVGAISSSLNQKGAVFGKPSAQGGSGNQGGELTKEQQDAINFRGDSAKDGQPF